MKERFNMNDKFREKYLQQKAELEDMLSGGAINLDRLNKIRGGLGEGNECNGGKLIIPSMDWNNPLCMFGVVEQGIYKSIKRTNFNLAPPTIALIYLTTYGSQVNDTYFLDGDKVGMLHSVIVAPSGYTKTETLQSIYKPLSEIDTIAEENYKKELDVWKEGERLRQKQKDNPNAPIVAQAKAKPKPEPKDYILTANTNPNAFKKFLSDKEKNNTNVGTFIYQGEMTSFFEGMGKFSGKSTQEAGEMSSVLDGDLTKDYYVKGRYTIRKPRFGMCGAIPNGTFVDILTQRTSMITQGFFSRFVYSTYYPEEVRYRNFKLHRDRGGDGEKIMDEYEFEKRLLDKLINSPAHEMELDEEAGKLFTEYSHYITDRINYYGEGDNIIDGFKNSLTFHATKKIMSLSVILHKLNETARIIEGTQGSWTDIITEKELRFAINFISFFNNSLFDFVDFNCRNIGAFTSRQDTKRKEVIRNIIRRVKNEANDESYEILPSTIKAWFRCLRGKDNNEAEQILDSMVESGFVKVKEDNRGKHYYPTTALLEHRDSRV